MPADPYEIVRARTIEQYGDKEGQRLMELYENNSHARSKHVFGAQTFFDFVLEWERACRRLKNSGADLSKIEIVKRG